MAEGPLGRLPGGPFRITTLEGIQRGTVSNSMGICLRLDTRLLHEGERKEDQEAKDQEEWREGHGPLRQEEEAQEDG
jgi:hypothetical protein